QTLIAMAKKQMKLEAEQKRRKEEAAKKKAQEEAEAARKEKEEAQKKEIQEKLAMGGKDKAQPVISEENKRAARQHYLDGVKAFQKQQWEEAKNQWNIVLNQYDPNHTEAKKGLERVAQIEGISQ
ncbi:MAG: hypothetical protein NTW04_03220, partial [Elusimicrobia bacterium]|nr:hypothetical protein [Elusimicrobiota bacterium]